jgi:LytR_cpsA_psr family
MNGVTAVEYARMRHPDSDFGRQTRQQQVLLALRDQVLQLDTLPRLPQVIPQVIKLVRTDLSLVEIGQLIAFGQGLVRDRDIVTLAPNPRLTPSYTGPGGASYVNLTPAYRATVKNLIEHPRVVAERADITIYNAGAPVGVGSRAVALLGRVGLVVSKTEIAPCVAARRIEAGAAARETAAVAKRWVCQPMRWCWSTTRAAYESCSARTPTFRPGDRIARALLVTRGLRCTPGWHRASHGPIGARLVSREVPHAAVGCKWSGSVLRHSRGVGGGKPAVVRSPIAVVSMRAR